MFVVEDVSPNCAAFWECIPASGSGRVLITSQEPLHQANERAVPVTHAIHLQPISTNESIQLQRKMNVVTSAPVVVSAEAELKALCEATGGVIAYDEPQPEEKAKPKKERHKKLRNELHALEQLSLPEVKQFLEHPLGNLPLLVSLCGHLLRADDALQGVHDLISQFEQVQLREVDSDGRSPKTDTHYLGLSRTVQMAVLRIEQSSTLYADDKQAALSLLAALLALPRTGTPRKLLEVAQDPKALLIKKLQEAGSHGEEAGCYGEQLQELLLKCTVGEVGCHGEEESRSEMEEAGVLAVFQDAATLSRAAQVLQQYGLMQPGVDGSIGTLHQLVQWTVHGFWLPSSGEANGMAPHVVPVFQAVRRMLVARFKSSNDPADWRWLWQLEPCAEHLHQKVVNAASGSAGLEFDHSDAALLAERGKFCDYQGQHRKAENLELEVLEFRQRELGDEHPDTATSKANLAAMYSKLG